MPKAVTSADSCAANKPRDRSEFEVAVFCAVLPESNAVCSLFDRHWDQKEYGKVTCDPNSYELGAIGRRNVVLVYLPGMGKGIAASAASSCHASFTGIRLALVVGICGGVPFGPDHAERVLGDVVISDSLVQYDLGRQFPDEFMRKSTLHDSLSRPNAEMRSFLARLRGRQNQSALAEAMRGHLAALRARGNAAYEYPGADADILYEPSHLHKHRDAAQCRHWAQTCGGDKLCYEAKESGCHELACDGGWPMRRRRLAQPAQHGGPRQEPLVHIGTVASGDTVMKSGHERDKVAGYEGIIAFEMEWAGVWDHFPCLVIKGICDYADCHKSKLWQDYAAATAAACMKAVLEQWD